MSNHYDPEEMTVGVSAPQQHRWRWASTPVCALVLTAGVLVVTSCSPPPQPKDGGREGKVTGVPQGPVSQVPAATDREKTAGQSRTGVEAPSATISYDPGVGGAVPAAQGTSVARGKFMRRVQLSQGAAGEFVIKNLAGGPIETEKFLVFPAPLGDQHLDSARSFSAALGRIEDGAEKSVKPDAITNALGAKLSESTIEANVVGINGRMGGELDGCLFVREDKAWVPSPPGKQWYVMEQSFFEVDRPKYPELKMKLSGFGKQREGKLEGLFVNSEEDYPIEDLQLTIFPKGCQGGAPDKEKMYSSPRKKLGKGEFDTIDFHEFTDTRGQKFSDCRLEIGFVATVGTVNGTKKAVYRTGKFNWP